MVTLSLGLAVVVLLSFIKDSASKGVLEFKFVSYFNEEGDGDNGHCCDGRLIFCGSQCDHQFKLCVDKLPGMSSVDCYTSGEVSNQDNIPSFGYYIGNTRNYFKVHFDTWPGRALVNVKIVDRDDNADDFVETLEKNVYRWPTKPARYTAELLASRTKLELDIRVSCDSHYYTRDCSVYCKPQNDATNGFYSCNPVTGAKICHRGWIGDNCNMDVDECSTSPCQNNGTCINNPGAYKCACREFYHGGHCEVSPVCSSEPCKNGGTCTEGFMLTYNCTCAFGYSGDTCDTRDDPCTWTPCENSGVCASDPVTYDYNCTCSNKWIGDECEILNPPFKPITLFGETTRITLLGEIDDKNMPELVDGLKNLARELGEVNGTIIVQLETQVLEVKIGTVITEVEFLVANDYGRNIIDNKSIDAIFKDNKPEVINGYLPLPLYFSSAGIADPAAVKGMKPIVHRDWSADNWYVFLIIALICVAAVAVFGFFFIRRKRSAKEEIKDGLPNNFDSPPENNMAFENVMYHENNENNESREQQPSTTLPSMTRPLPDDPDTLGGAAGAKPLDNAYDIPKPVNHYQDIDEFQKPEPPPPRCGATALGPYLDMNGTSQRVDNTYQDFNKLAVSMKDVEESEENPYHDIDKMKEEFDISDLSSDSEDEIAKAKASFA